MATGELTGVGRGPAGMRLAGVPVLIYHGLTNGVAPDVPWRERKYWVSARRFEEHLAEIRAGGYRTAALEELDGRPSRGEREPVVLTFDDGRASDYELAFPILAEQGACAEFFVNTATVGEPGYLGWSQIDEMQRSGMSFQSHGHDHVDLVGLPTHALVRQLRESKQRLEDGLGAAVDFVAVPYGRVSRRVVATAREEGYRAVCTSRTWPARPGAATISRVVIYGGTTRRELAGLLARRPLPYLGRVARGACLAVAKRLVLLLRPGALDGGQVEGRA